jgi:TfoX/Sxy family transcriptional regulator of competence genes
MAYSKSLTLRIRKILGRRHGVNEKRRFGGVGFLLNGNMCVGIWKNSLITRINPENYEDALNEQNVHEFDVTGRTMRGWVLVEPDGIDSDEQLSDWVRRSVDFVSTLPRK